MSVCMVLYLQDTFLIISDINTVFLDPDSIGMVKHVHCKNKRNLTPDLVVKWPEFKKNGFQ